MTDFLLYCNAYLQCYLGLGLSSDYIKCNTQSFVNKKYAPNLCQKCSKIKINLRKSLKWEGKVCHPQTIFRFLFAPCFTYTYTIKVDFVLLTKGKLMFVCYNFILILIQNTNHEGSH